MANKKGRNETQKEYEARVKKYNADRYQKTKKRKAEEKELEDEEKAQHNKEEIEFDKLKRELEQSQRRNGLMKGQLVTANTNVQKLTKKKEDQVEMNVVLTQQMRTMGTQIKESKRDFDRSQSKIVELEKRNDAAKKTMTTMKTQGEELTKQVSLSRSENLEQNQQNNVLKQQMDTMKLKYEESQRELEASKQEVRKFQTSQHECNEKNKRNVIQSSKEIDDLKNKNNKLEKDLHSLDRTRIEHNGKLDEEVATLTRQLHEQRLLFNEKEQECKQISFDWKEREEQIENVMKEQRDTITGQSLEISTLNDKVKSTKTK